ncbi:MAG: hypothetical protein Q7U04_11565 [Bacteriovorax sp.]|nr:hypothetical protein [Bacteriovorax sp.]
MKALVIASVLFFSLRAMSSELGENQKSDCPFISQTSKNKEVTITDLESTKQVGTRTVTK